MSCYWLSRNHGEDDSAQGGSCSSRRSVLQTVVLLPEVMRLRARTELSSKAQVEEPDGFPTSISPNLG